MDTHDKKPSPARKRTDLTLRKVRSSITNGSTLFGGNVDERLPYARRYRDLMGLYLDDLGGPHAVSEAERAIIRRAVTLTVQCEIMEARFARQEGDVGKTRLDLYGRTANSLRRLLEATGIHRRVNSIIPDPLDYAKRKREAQDAEVLA